MSHHHVTAFYSFLWPNDIPLCGHSKFCLSVHQIDGHSGSFHFSGSASFFFSLGWLGDEEDVVDEANCSSFGRVQSFNYPNHSGSLSGHMFCLAEGNIGTVRCAMWHIHEHPAEVGSLNSLVQSPPSCSRAAPPPSHQPTPSSRSQALSESSDPQFPLPLPGSLLTLPEKVLGPLHDSSTATFCPSLIVTLSCSEFTWRVHFSSAFLLGSK